MFFFQKIKWQWFFEGVVVVLCGFSCKGKSIITFLRGQMNNFAYSDLLEENLLHFSVNLETIAEVIPQNSASICNVNSVGVVYGSWSSCVMAWPTASSDLNPMQKVWNLKV